MKVEVVDRRNPMLIRVASIVDTEDYRVKVSNSFISNMSGRRKSNKRGLPVLLNLSHRWYYYNEVSKVSPSLSELINMHITHTPPLCLFCSFVLQVLLTEFCFSIEYVYSL